MIWLAWRQLRVSAYAVFGFLALCALAFALTGPHLVHVFDTIVKPCAKHGDCSSVKSTFLSSDAFLQHLVQLMVILPAVVGAFWGAPLVAREFESGSYRLAWTQSVTRTKWLAMKLAVVGGTSVLVVGLFTLMATWWSSPLDRLNDSPFGVFDSRDLAPLGYAAFAFALGVSLGVLIRRTVPAMAATLLGFVGVRLFFTDKIRPYFETPLRLVTKFQLPFSTAAYSGKSLPFADWPISEETLNAKGQVIGHYGGFGPNGDVGFQFKNTHDVLFDGVGRCPNVFPKSSPPHGVAHAVHSVFGGSASVQGGPGQATLAAMQKCANSFHLTTLTTYQPTSRYWPFQWYEFSSYLVFALVLSALTIWWVRRH